MDSFGGVAADVRLVNGAKGGVPVEAAMNPNSTYWDFCLNQVADAGLSPAQVQVFFLLTENVSFVPVFPDKAETLADQMRAFLTVAKENFPNARICYATSRLYGGYSNTPHATEPIAYWNGFAVKFLIERQIQGDPLLDYQSAGGGDGPGLVPWLAWGPYAWADGQVPDSDGLTWECGDFSTSDGHHLAGPARAEVGERLHEFLSSDATAAPWYPATAPQLCPPTARVDLFGVGPGGNGAPGDGSAYLAASRLPQPAHPDAFHVALIDAPGESLGGFLWGVDSIVSGTVPFFDGWLLVDGAQLVGATTDVHGQARWSFPVLPEVCGGEVVVQGAALSLVDLSISVTPGLRLRLGH